MTKTAIVTAALLASLAAPAWASETLLTFGEAPVVSDETLEELRGGLSMGNDFNLSFGITRTVAVNGEIIAVQGLRLNDLGNLFRGGMPSVETIGRALTIVQLGGNNFAATNTSASTSSSGGATTQAGAPAFGGATSFSVPGMTAGGVTGVFGNSFATGIQNSLNDVRIQSRTQIDASVAAFNALRSSFASSLLRDNLVGSGTR